MSISGNTSPMTEGFQGFNPEAMAYPARMTPTVIKKIKSCLNKISERNFDKISDEILSIQLLEDLDETEVKDSDKEIVLPVVETFMANICVFERNNEAINIYTKTFCKLKNKWKGRQKDVLMDIMMSELAKFFNEYNKSIQSESILESSEEWILKRNQCLKICQFVSSLYNEEAVGIKLILVILNLFMKPKKESIEVFCKLVMGCQTKLMSEELFRTKILPKYKTFLQEHHSSKTLEPMYRFLCLEVLDKF